jgi:hypothetical protein
MFKKRDAWTGMESGMKKGQDGAKDPEFMSYDKLCSKLSLNCSQLTY